MSWGGGVDGELSMWDSYSQQQGKIGTPICFLVSNQDNPIYAFYLFEAKSNASCAVYPNVSRYKKFDKKVQVDSSSCSIGSGICWQVVGKIVQIRNLNARPSGLAAFNTVKESA